MKRKIIGRILVLLSNLTIMAIVIMLIVDKEWGVLAVVAPLACISFYVEIDELIHPDKYTWD